jgi:hypothetical protein
MDVQQAFSARDHHNAKPSSPARLLRDISFALYSPLWPRFCKKLKKGASRLVQSSLNLFIINRIFQKIASKKRQKTSQINPNSTLFGLFPAFSGTLRLRRIIAPLAEFLALLFPWSVGLLFPAFTVPNPWSLFQGMGRYA